MTKKQIIRKVVLVILAIFGFPAIVFLCNPDRASGQELRICVEANKLRVHWFPNVVDDDLLGFHLHQGPTPTGPFVQVNTQPIPQVINEITGNVEYDIENPTEGTWYFALSAEDTCGNKSEMGPVSEAVRIDKTPPVVPGQPEITPIE